MYDVPYNNIIKYIMLTRIFYGGVMGVNHPDVSSPIMHCCLHYANHLTQTFNKHI